MNITGILKLVQGLLPFFQTFLNLIDGGKNPGTKQKAQDAHDAVKALAEHTPANT